MKKKTIKEMRELYPYPRGPRGGRIKGKRLTNQVYIDSRGNVTIPGHPGAFFKLSSWFGSQHSIDRLLHHLHGKQWYGWQIDATLIDIYEEYTGNEHIETNLDLLYAN